MKGARGVVLRLAFSFTVLALVLLMVDVMETWAVLRGLAPMLLLLAFACYLTTRILVAFKWWVLLGGRSSVVSYAVVQRAIFLADYQGVLFPNTLAADAMRLLLLRHHPRGITYMTSTLIADRVVNVMVAAGMALCGMLLLVQLPAGNAIAPEVVSSVVTIALLLLTAGFALLSHRLFNAVVLLLERLLARGLMRKPILKVADKIRQLHGSMVAVLAHPETLAKAVSISVLVVLMRLAAIYCLFAAVGTLPGVLAVLAIYPIIMLFVLLPISILGIGVQDGAFIFFFGGIGIAASVSLAASLTFYAITLTAGVIAGIIAGLVGPPMPTAVKTVDAPGISTDQPH